MSEQENNLDGLKMKAEAMAVHEGLTRRPTWAPALLLGEELRMVLLDLNCLTGDDKAVARLWAQFTDPRRGKVVCEGFELRAGQEHKGKEIFRAQYADRAVTVARLKGWLAEPNIDHERMENSIRSWEAKESDWTLGPNYTKPQANWNAQLAARQSLWIRAAELAQQRVMEFAGGSEKQIFETMQAGARLTGRCCICGKTLTDPISLEYGIGPECRRGHNVRLFPGALWLDVQIKTGGSNGESDVQNR